MKKLFLIIGIAIVSFSCKKFLDEKPYDFVSPENIKGSSAGVRQMVTGMYSVFFDAEMFRNESWIYLTCSDDEWTNGLDWVLSTYGVGNFAGGWIYNNSGNDPYYVFYRMVRAANEVLEVLPLVDFDPLEADMKDQYEGEALTMRSLAYYYLVQMYGAVPLRLRSDAPDNMARTSIKQVYEQICNDLHIAEEKLFLNSKNPVSGKIRRGHFRKGAAQLLLAKVYATMGSGALTGESVTVPLTFEFMPDSTIQKTEKTFNMNKVAGYDFDPRVCYDSAKTVVTRLIDTKEYQMETYPNTWNPANFGGKDFVFALETDSLYSKATTPFNKFFTPVGLKGQGWISYTKDLYYLYDPTDARARYGIAHEWRSSYSYQGVYNRTIFPIEDSVTYFLKYGKGNVTLYPNSNVCYLMKWYVGNSSAPSLQLSASESTIVTTPTQNYPLLRYTEAFLILAEAENELNGPTSVAYDALDEIRSYRFPSSDEGMDRNFTKQSLRSYILDERNREFIGEGYRRFDLIRYGIYLDVMNAVEVRTPNLNSQTAAISKKREQKHLLYPVPTIEIDGNTLFGTNNPGW